MDNKIIQVYNTLSYLGTNDDNRNTVFVPRPAGNPPIATILAGYDDGAGALPNQEIPNPYTGVPTVNPNATIEISRIGRVRRGDRKYYEYKSFNAGVKQTVRLFLPDFTPNILYDGIEVRLSILVENRILRAMDNTLALSLPRTFSYFLKGSDSQLEVATELANQITNEFNRCNIGLGSIWFNAPPVVTPVLGGINIDITCSEVGFLGLDIGQNNIPYLEGYPVSGVTASILVAGVDEFGTYRQVSHRKTAWNNFLRINGMPEFPVLGVEYDLIRLGYVKESLMPSHYVANMDRRVDLEIWVNRNDPNWTAGGNIKSLLDNIFS